MRFIKSCLVALAMSIPFSASALSDHFEPVVNFVETNPDLANGEAINMI